MKIEITAKDRCLILSALNYAATNLKDLSAEMDNLYDKIATNPTEPTINTENPTADEIKRFWSWFANR